MKTYANSKGETAPDWKAELSQKKISEETWEALKAKAADWNTCSCGIQPEAVPRNCDGDPNDPVLRFLGHKFYDCIEAHEAENALNILAMVEMRAVFLIEDELEDRRKHILEMQKEARQAQKAVDEARKEFEQFKKKIK